MSNNKIMNMREGDIEDDSIYEQELDEQYDCSDCSYNDEEMTFLKTTMSRNTKAILLKQVRG